MKFIAYYRVSTKRQGESGLGLDAQKKAVSSHISDKGELLKEFVEIESGRASDANRPVLEAALALCKQTGACLIVAKLDRLYRSVRFTSTLMESDVDFYCCDAPYADPLSIHILSAIAEHEAKMIGQRTKLALQAAKARGTKLGTPENLTAAARKKGSESRRMKKLSNPEFKKMSAIVALYLNQGYKPAQITHELNQQGYKTPTGANIHDVYVRRIMSELKLVTNGRINEKVITEA